MCDTEGRIDEQDNLLELTPTEREIFIDAVLNPPAPNEALRLATKRYSKMVAHSV